MTIYSREVIDEEVKEWCNFCKAYKICKDVTLNFKGKLVHGEDFYKITTPCDIPISPINYCPMCGRKLK